MKRVTYNGERIWKATKREAIRIVLDMMSIKGKRAFKDAPYWRQNDCAVALDDIAKAQGSNWKNTFRDWMYEA